MFPESYALQGPSSTYQLHAVSGCFTGWMSALLFQSYRGHRQSVRAALFTKPEGMHLISSSLDGDLRLWSVVDRCALAVIHSSTSYLSDLCLTQGMFSTTIKATRIHEFKVSSTLVNEARLWWGAFGLYWDSIRFEVLWTHCCWGLSKSFIANLVV